MNIKQTVLTVGALGIMSGGLAVAAAPQAAAATQCSILPQSICNDADNGILENSGLWGILIFALQLLTAGIGLTAVGFIVFAGFLYTTASGSSEQTKKAIEMIRNTVIGLIAYGLMYVGLNFIIPGGVFK